MSDRPTYPTPHTLFQVVSGFQGSDAIEGGIDLDLFTAIGEGADTPQTLAQRCDAPELGVRVLADYLVTVGILSKNSGKYSLTPAAAAFLDRRSPSCLVPLFKLMLAPSRRAVFSHLAPKVRGEHPHDEEGSDETARESYWVEFARAFAPLDKLNAELLAEFVEARGIRPSRILDIAAGHGLWGIAIAKRNHSAGVVAVDSPAVTEVARANAEDAGLGSRFETIGGDALNVELGRGYDLALITNFFAGRDEAYCRLCLSRVHSALNDGGHLVLLDVVPNEDRVTPMVPAQFALTILAGGGTGHVQSLADYTRLLESTGFAAVETSPLEPSVERVILAQR